MGTADRTRGRFEEVRAFIGEVYGHDLHAQRIDLLAGATLGLMTGASVAVAMIGHALAQARGLVTKHAVKQVDGDRALCAASAARSIGQGGPVPQG